MELREERRAARAYLEGRQLVSEAVYDGKVVSTGRGFSWVQLFTMLEDVPEEVQQQLKEMTAAVKKKIGGRRKSALDSDVEYVVYVGSLDLQQPKGSLKVGSKVQLKLYTDSKGVGGCNVTVLEEADESVEAVAEALPNAPKPIAPGLVNGQGAVKSQEVLMDEAVLKAPRPRYMKDFEAKVAEEEREVLDGIYEGEVVQRSKTYAWIKPRDPSSLPVGVQSKVQEMCDGFRKRAEEGDRVFCGGIEENVIYVANPDLSVKGAILCVGMQVTFKLYTDNKGVGGYDVVPSEDHIQKMREAIRNNFKTDDGKRKTLPWSSIWGQGDAAFKDVLFIGECTHEFSLAVTRLCGLTPCLGETEHPFRLAETTSWCSTELRWPRAFEQNLELQLAENLKKLRSIGVWCSEAVDAHKVKQTLEKTSSTCCSFDTVFWMMPYVPDGCRRPPTSIAPMMYYCIDAFVQSALDVCKDDGSIMVVVTSAQCLSWNLYQCRPKVGDKEIIPDVWWFDVSEYEEHGYQSRFGDGRDRFVDRPVFHSLCDMVAVRWRPAAAESPVEGGVTEDEIAERKKQIEEVGKEPQGG